MFFCASAAFLFSAVLWVLFLRVVHALNAFQVIAGNGSCNGEAVEQWAVLNKTKASASVL
jgi:hypothetical protein